MATVAWGLPADPIKMNVGANSRSLHSVEEWDQIRPLFSKLYIDESRKLDDVSQILEHQYGFRATRKMYKIRISQWNLHKYNRRSQGRIVRKTKRGKIGIIKSDKTCNKLTSSKRVEQPQNLTIEQSLALPRELTVSGSFKQADDALACVRALIKSHIRGNITIISLTGDIEAARPATELLANTGVLYRMRRNEDARKSYDRALSVVNTMLDDVDSSNLWFLLSVFCKLTSNWLGPAMESIINYLADYDIGHGRPPHPTCAIARAVRNAGDAKGDLVESIVSFARDCLLQENGNKKTWITDCDLIYSIFLQRRGRYQDSLTQLLKLYEICLQDQELRDRFESRILYEIGWTFDTLGLGTLALSYLERSWESLVRLRRSTTWCGYETLYAIARCNKNLGNLDLSHRQAMKLKIRARGLNADPMWNGAIRSLLKELETISPRLATNRYRIYTLARSLRRQSIHLV